MPEGHRGVTQVVRNRCSRFLEGDWEGLYIEVAATVRQSASAQSELRVVQEVLKLVKAGELSRAAQRLDASQVAPANQDTLELLRRLHPVGDGMPAFPAAELERLDAAAIELQREHFDKVISALPSASAPGANYWRWEHVKVLRRGAETGDSLFALCCHLAKGRLPEDVRNYFAGARLVAFLKDPDGDHT